MSVDDVNVGRTPIFNETNYSYWKVSMSCVLEAMSLDIWHVDYYGLLAPLNPLAAMDVELKNLHYNAQAKNTLFWIP